MPSRSGSTPSDPPQLRVPRENLAAELREQVGRGQELLEKQIRSDAEYRDLRGAVDTWREYNVELLRRRFTTAEIADNYAVTSKVWMVTPDMDWTDFYERLQTDLKAHIRRLQSVVERLALMDEVDGLAHSPLDDRPKGSAVFLVHGHDEAIREAVARVLERLGLEVVILHEQANKGLTLIEKFEAHAQNAGFAVSLVTSDDEGRSREPSEELLPRARQNVVFETGFFFGALGRGRVAVLYEEGVELPSDTGGIAWIPLKGDWKLGLSKELKAAGFAVDMNRI